MSARLEVELDSAVPVYEQIRAQVAAHVAAGRLAAGDRLPPIRTLAADLGLAPGTVARAFRELEAAGVVVTRRRTGTVVAERAAVAHPEVRAAAERYVAAARAAGLCDEAAIDLVRGALLQPDREPA
ncbi:MAG: GntR family transcriptional regulator [Micrococcales bacterium]|nr:GntR family transcriptional regulator [Micrococcales bacterium]MCL2666556.1 GntR family transcriptional regulator [Micrococcales bacterium]